MVGPASHPVDTRERSRPAWRMGKSEPRTQQPVTLDTLADLGPGYRLNATRERSDHTGCLDVPTLMARHGDMPLDQLRARIRCGRCGAGRPRTTLPWDNAQ
jgi:ribosomal protein S27AE